MEERRGYTHCGGSWSPSPVLMNQKGTLGWVGRWMEGRVMKEMPWCGEQFGGRVEA